MRMNELLTENVHCPNCGKRAIIRVYNGVEQREYYKCEYCGQVYETDSVVDELYTFKQKEQKEKEMEFFELRELIDSLRYHIKTVHDEGIINCLRAILNKMTDIIERKE